MRAAGAAPSRDGSTNSEASIVGSLYRPWLPALGLERLVPAAVPAACELLGSGSHSFPWLAERRKVSLRLSMDFFMARPWSESAKKRVMPSA